MAELLERGILPLVPILTRLESVSQRVREAQARNRVRELAGTILYREAQRSRMRIEHCFAEAKEWHGLDRARGYGLDNMNVQALMTATVQNLKRLARFLRRTTGKVQVAARSNAAGSGVQEMQAYIKGIQVMLEHSFAHLALPGHRSSYVPC